MVIFFKKLKSKYKNYILNSVLIFSFILIILLSNIGFQELNINNRNIIEKNKCQKSNDSDITIISPANITYKEPMEGYYVGTYFGPDLFLYEENWNYYNNGMSVFARPIDYLDGHSDIIQLEDNSSEDTMVMQYSDGNLKGHGSCTFWFRIENSLSGKTRIFEGFYNISLILFNLCIKDGEWKCVDNNSYITVPNVHDPILNHWYPIQIDWCSDGSNWKGLNDNQWSIVIDDISSGVLTYNNSLDYNPIHFRMVTANDNIINYSIYYDALSFSWDLGFTEFNYLNEGLGLIMTSSMSFYWIKYSLDGQPNRTIITLKGNTTIPLPSNGLHFIQIFGNNSWGEIVQSNINYFTIDYHPINLNTPESKVYTEPMEGHYIGRDFDFFSLYYATKNSSISKVASYNFHNNVLCLNITDDFKSLSLTHFFENVSEEDDIIEFYYLPATIGPFSSVIIYTCEGTNELVNIRFGWNYGDLECYYSGKYNLIADGIFIAENWYHIKIVTDDSANMYDLYINDLIIGNNIPYQNLSIVGPDRIVVGSTSLGEPCESYIDAFGIPSRNPYYSEGDNLNEGLLLSYTTSLPFKWMGYSLDGQANRTISGNITIPMPAEGRHNIQVFGNTTSGTYYTSDIRQFIIKTGIIEIITPEDIIYSEPDEGYYPGTYGFENDNNGAFPSGWDDITTDPTYCEVTIEPEYKGHNKVLRLYDGYSDSGWTSHAATCEVNFSTTTKSTLEFWFLKASGTTSCEFQIRENEDIKIDFGVDPANNGLWQWRTSSGWIELPEEYYQDDEWIHVRVDFDLVNDIANFTLNNEVVLIDVDIYNNVGNVNKIRMGTNTGWEGVVYFDAFSVSSDSNYNIGDNLKEGLLLSFTNTTQLDWMGYSLDGQANKTILGNTTIPMPADGSHTIQVFGNNTSGTYYASDIRQFTVRVGDIELITPEEITYTGPMAGYYPSTYGFDNEIVGVEGTAISFINRLYYTYGTVYARTYESEDHQICLEMYEGSATAKLQIQNDFNTTVNNGTIEFWLYPYQTTHAGSIMVTAPQGGDNGIKVQYGSDGGWEYFNGQAWIDINGATYSALTWHHIRISWDCDDIYYKLYINGVDVSIAHGEELIYQGNPNDFDSLAYLELGYGYTEYSIGKELIDAIGYSWDPNYNLGDNLNEGLFLSFTNTTQLDWMGYSLDGKTNRTISGNTTIPMPQDGPHIIQIFGNKTSGTYYASNIRHFIIDTTTPNIIGIDFTIEIERNSICEIQWTLLEENGGSYIILKDNQVESMGVFNNNEIITIKVDTSKQGYFNYTIIATDSSGKSSNHSVIIHVKYKDTEVIIPGYNIIILITISSIIIWFITWIIKRNSKIII